MNRNLEGHLRHARFWFDELDNAVDQAEVSHANHSLRQLYSTLLLVECLLSREAAS